MFSDVLFEGVFPCPCVMCLKQLLVCSVNWRDVLNYIVINIHSSVVSAINHLLIRVKRFQWFINTGFVDIYRICVLKSSVCCRCVINSVKTGCCSTNSVVRNVLIIGHNDAMISCETRNFWSLYCSFFYVWNPFQETMSYQGSRSWSPCSRLTAEICWAEY